MWQFNKNDDGDTPNKTLPKRYSSIGFFFQIFHDQSYKCLETIKIVGNLNVPVLYIQNQSFADVLQNRCS